MAVDGSKLDALRSEGDLNISPRRAEWARRENDEKTRGWLEEDARWFLHQSLSTPCLDVLSTCDGAEIVNLQGRRILDFHGNNVHQVGFRNPKVIAAVVEQMSTLPFCTRRYTNVPAIRLASKLAELAPGDLNKVLLTPSGTAAIGMALKLARSATGRFKTISMWDSFHGASLDAISLGGEAIFRRGIGPLLPGSEHVPPPDPLHCPFVRHRDCNACDLQCADYVEYVLEKEGDVAAVVAETVRSTPFIPPRGYWERVRTACTRHGALLILDEIPHCLGRTGRMFTCQNYDLVPDILVLGKGLGGGVFPLAAIVAREGLDVAGDRALGHYTHEKNPVACAAALAAIEYIEENGLLEHARRMGGHALRRMRGLQEKHSLVGDVRGLGLLMGMELVRNRETGERAVDEAEQVMYAALSRGLNFKLTMGSILTLTPALTISEAQMDRAMDILDECLAEVRTRP